MKTAYVVLCTYSKYVLFSNIYTLSTIPNVYMLFNVQTNTFQCILATSTTATFVMFLYADGGIQWSRNIVAGINAGNGINYTTIPGSRTSSIMGISRTSNVGILGIWMFKVDEGYNAANYYDVQ